MSSMLNQKSLFSFDHTIYWPKKYERIVAYLHNGTGDKQNHQSLYKSNVEVIVLAACIGLNNQNPVDVPSDRNEINLFTFNSHSLSIYLYLIPLLAQDEVSIDFFRNKDGEDRAISIFQRYAAGGLEILNERLASRGMDSPYLFTSDLLINTDDSIRELPIDIF
jgi:dnd system-associated protein 4